MRETVRVQLSHILTVIKYNYVVVVVVAVAVIHIPVAVVDVVHFAAEQSSTFVFIFFICDTANERTTPGTNEHEQQSASCAFFLFSPD